MNIWVALVVGACFARWTVKSMRYGFGLATIATWQMVLSMVFPSGFWHGPAPVVWYSPVSATNDEFKYAIASVHTSKPRFAIDTYQWDVLSSGKLQYTRANEAHVRFGINTIAQNGGLHIGMLARDIAGNLDAIMQNVEALSLFLPTVSVTFFENDSVDGTRQKIKEWQARPKRGGLSVHLLDCPGVVDCKLQLAHRYRDVNSKLQKMALFRNRVAEYITANVSKGRGWMLVADSDLDANWSPLGIITAIGKYPGNAIASRGLMLWPSTFGTIALPYDLMAFQQTHGTYSVLSGLHSLFAMVLAGGGLSQPSDALSPFKLAIAVASDYADTPRRVASAFNGLSVYPIPQIARLNATYSAGNGYDCEHLAFSRYFNDVVIDPVWTVQLTPESPGGPTGRAALAIYLQVMQKAIFWPVAAVTLVTHAFAHAAVHASFVVWFKHGRECHKPQIGIF